MKKKPKFGLTDNICETCGKKFKSLHKAKFCPNCRMIRETEQLRKHKKKYYNKKKAKGKIKKNKRSLWSLKFLGSKKKVYRRCKRCGKFLQRFNAKHCSKCSNIVCHQKRKV